MGNLVDVTPQPPIKRAAGTRNFWDVVKALGRSPSEAAKRHDADEVAHGVGRMVSCHLRGSATPYPQRFKYGTLSLVNNVAVWRPYWWSIPRTPIAIDEHVSS